MPHIRPEPADADHHLFLLELADGTRQRKQVERLFERDRSDQLPFSQARETRFLRIVGIADLGDRAETSDFDVNRLAALRIGSEQMGLTASDRLAFERPIHRRMELFVELTDHIDPTFIPFGNFVELLFDHRRKIIVHHIGKLLVEIIGHQHADIGRRKLVFLFPYMLAELFADNLPFFEFQLDIPPFAALAVLFNHIAARDDRRNRRRIGGRAADPQLFKPFDQRRLAVTRRTLRETLQRRNAFRLRPIPLFQRGQQRLFALLRLVFGRFGIQFQ